MYHLSLNTSNIQVANERKGRTEISKRGERSVTTPGYDYSMHQTLSLPREQGLWGQHGAHLGPTGPRWAPRWPHELCYLGGPLIPTSIKTWPTECLSWRHHRMNIISAHLSFVRGIHQLLVNSKQKRILNRALLISVVRWDALELM